MAETDVSALQTQAAETMVEHVTKDGTRYRLPAARFRAMVHALRPRPTRGMWVGALLPVVLCVAAVLFQYFVAGAGLVLSERALSGLEASSLRPGLWPSHLLLHTSATWMAVNVVLLLGFGVFLGWKDGTLRLLFPAVVAAVVGSLAAFLKTSAEPIGLWYVIVGVISVAAWRFPTGRLRETAVPWTLIAGALVLVLVPRLLGGVAQGTLLPAVAAALLAGVFVLPTREMDCGRVGAVATFIAIAFAVRFSDRVFALFEMPGTLLSATNWLGIVFDLLVLVIAGTYAASQAEMLQDMRFWPLRDRLDSLVAKEGERVEG
ncbi:MAG: hypothetical protein FJ109_06050 [Deltaproteobacteria bacterium]|nr:hypothetical protein [Deltaproteobacteria bacterium]